jgi:molecular chaperone Hsp33
VAEDRSARRLDRSPRSTPLGSCRCQIRCAAPAASSQPTTTAPEPIGEPARIRALGELRSRAGLGGEALPLRADRPRPTSPFLIDQGEGTTPTRAFTPLGGLAFRSAPRPTSPVRAAPHALRPGLWPLAPGWRGGALARRRRHDPAHAQVGMAWPPPKRRRRTASRTTATSSMGEEGENWLPRQHPPRHRGAPGARGSAISPPTPPSPLHEEGPRIFEAHPVGFGCSCGPDKVRQSLSIYSRMDIRHIIHARRHRHRRTASF